MIRLSSLLLLALLLCSARVNAQTVQTIIPSTNGTVTAIRSSGSTIYIGGEFTYVGKPLGHAILSSTSTSTVNTSFPVIGTETSDAVKAIAPDGSGGFYIVGSFTSVAGSTRNNIARINSDGTLNAWNPGNNCNSSINAVAVSADFNTVYIGGFFTTIGQSSSSARNRIAAISASTGNATTWNPGISGGGVNCLALSASNTIYVGGSFTTSNTIGANAVTRNRIAEINTGDNNGTTWNPNANSDVNTVLLSGSNVYVGGSFTSIGGATRNYIARIPNSSSTADSWNPNSDNTINALAISGTTVFAGGLFSSIGGVTVGGVAALDAGTNTNMASSTWISNISINSGTPTIKSLTVDGTTLYVGGTYNSIASTVKSNLCAVNISSLASFTLASFSTTTGSNVNTTCVSGTNIYIGGDFYVSDGSARNYIASINGTTGAINSWNPNANNTVKDIYISNNGNDAYVSGQFTSIGGQSRNRLAKLSTSTGNADGTWNPNADNTVEKMSMNSTETTLFFYGGFSNINGATARANAAAVSTTGTGVATAFSFTGLPDITTRLISVAPGDSIVYFGYNSTGVTINSVTRNYFCAVRASNGTTSNWNPLFNQAPFTVVYVGTTMYMGGQFSSLDGSACPRLAKFSAAAGWHEPVHDLTWNNTSSNIPSGEVRTLIYTSGGTSPLLYFSGSFSSVLGSTRQSYAAIKASDLTVMPWNLNVDNNATLNARMHLNTTTNKIYIGDNANSSFAGTRAYNFLAISGDASDPLPIKLVEFNGEYKNEAIELAWTTAIELNCEKFEIEKYNELTNEFERIGEQAGHGYSKELHRYHFTDHSPLSVNYYKLKELDFDGNAEYSKTISINTIPSAKASIAIYPNPSTNVSRIYYTLVAEQTTITVYDQLGRKIKTIDNIQDKTGMLELDLGKGIYFVNVASGNELINKKIIIQ